jgi:hypothetical protein
MAEVARWLLRLCGVLNSNSHFCGVSRVMLGVSEDLFNGGGGDVAAVVPVVVTDVSELEKNNKYISVNQ